MRSRRVLGCTAEYAITQHHYHGRAASLQWRPALAVPRTKLCTPRGPFNYIPIRLLTASSCPQTWRAIPPLPPSIHPTSSRSNPSLPLGEQLRGLMRLLAHSVVVCTSTLPARAGARAGGGATSLPPTWSDGQHNRPQPRAMTMSSFTSLAVGGVGPPAVTFNVATPSRTLDAMEASRRFNIHVLTGNVAGARVADWFTKGNTDGVGSVAVFDGLRDLECDLVERKALGGGSDIEKPDGEPPVLSGPGISYVLHCRLMEEPSQGLVRVRDHVIVLGEVLEIEEGRIGTDADRASEAEGRFGLVYADRRYRQLGRILVDKPEDDP